MRNIYWLFAFIALIACTNEDLLQTEKTTQEDTEQVVTQTFENGHVRILVTEDLSGQMEAAALIGEQRTKAMAADDAVSEIKAIVDFKYFLIFQLLPHT